MDGIGPDIAMLRSPAEAKTLATFVRDTAAAVNAIRAAISLATEVNGHEALARQCKLLERSWPVEGAGREEALKTLSLLIVLRRMMLVAQVGGDASWSLVAERGGPAGRALAACASGAESLPDVNGLLDAWQTRHGSQVARVLAEIEHSHAAVLAIAIVYEMLLARLDRQQRAGRGVFHTPSPVAQWMVQAAHWLIEEHLPRDQPLRFIDPGCGCGTFLSELLRADAFATEAAPRRAAPNAQLGYEVLGTAWAVAHWLLDEASQQRGLPSPALDLQWSNPLLSGDAEADRIVGGELIPVIIGNPPYSNFGGHNRGPWIDGLVTDYKQGLHERKTNLGDAFVKFLRWGQHWIDVAGQGLVVLVTSSTYLAGLTHRGMRESLLRSFTDIYLLDLGGGVAAHSADTTTPVDENVFSVRSGVVIGLFLKRSAAVERATVHYSAMRGTRQSKFAALQTRSVQELTWEVLKPQPPDFLLRPANSPLNPASEGVAAEYAEYWPLTRIFREWVSGVQTKNDRLFVDFDRERLSERIQLWLADQQHLNKGGVVPEFDPRHLRPYFVAPLDRHWIYYDPRLLGRARWPVMRHMLQPNIGLVFMRQSTNAGEYDHFLAVDGLVSDRIFCSVHGAPYLAPLWLHGSDEDGTAAETRSPNFQPEWLAAVSQRIDRPVDPLELFEYCYATVYRTDYRQRFANLLRTDFPRLPLPTTATQFEQHAHLGRALVRQHLNSSDDFAKPSPPETTAAAVSIGGYRVLDRWRLKRRPQVLTADDQRYEERLIEVLNQTHALRSALDALPRP